MELPFVRQAIEIAGRFLGLAILDELLHQLPAGIVLDLLGSLGRAGEKHSALDFHQRGRENEEFAGPFDVDSLDRVQMFEKLLGNLGDGNVADIDLMPLNQIEKQVERAVEGVERDLVDHP